MHLNTIRKRSFLWSLFLCLFSTVATGQHFDWAVNIGGLGLDVGRDVTTDTQGNVIVVGSFSGSASIAGTFLSGEGVREAFIAKFTPEGTLLWANVITGPDEDFARGVVTDDEGSIYVVGHFTDTATFYISETDTAAARSEGGKDVFIVKYDADGNFVWHVTAGGPDDDTATDVDWHQWTGKLYVSGGFQDRGKFGNKVLLSNGQTDAFLMKLDGEGNVHWVKHGGGQEHDVAAAVAVNEAGQIYIVGDYYVQAEFGGDTLQSIGSSDMFLARFNSEGDQLWIRSNGGTNVDVATDIGVDLNGKVYVSGYYQLTTHFQNLSVTANGYNDVFLSQFDADGNCNWLSSAGSNALDNCLGMAVAWDGTTYLTGMFDEEMFADGISFQGDGYDVYVLCYNSSGEIRYGRAAGDASSDFGMATCLGPDQSLYITGYYFYYADFDGNTIGIAENGDGFLARMTDILSIENAQNNQTNCIHYNTVDRTVSVGCHTIGTWSLFNGLGQKVLQNKLQKTFVLPELSMGIYHLVIETNEAVLGKKILITSE